MVVIFNNFNMYNYCVGILFSSKTFCPGLNIPFVHMINIVVIMLKLTLQVNFEPFQGTARYVW